jgi:hypothetical protein
MWVIFRKRGFGSRPFWYYSIIRILGMRRKINRSGSESKELVGFIYIQYLMKKSSEFVEPTNRTRAASNKVRILREKYGSGYALQRKSHLCIPFLGIARPQPQFQHSCVCERFI